MTGAMVAVLICAFAGLFNAAVDPFGIVHWIDVTGFNHYKPAQQTRIRMVKAEDIARIRPRAIVLGTSRSHIGLRMDHPGWTAWPRYNAAFDGATSEEMYDYLQHAEAMAPLKQVVLGIDTWQLEENPASVRPDFDGTLLARADEPLSGIRTSLAQLRIALSLDTASASLATLGAQTGEQPHWFAADGQRRGPEFFRRRDGDFEAAGPRTYFLAIDRQEILSKRPADPSVHESVPAHAELNSFGYFRKIVTFCRENGIDLRIYITPAHAHQREIEAAMGEWARVEKGKRDLVDLLEDDAAKHHVQSVPLWDFSTYSSVTEEPLPTDARSELRFYWDSSHFKEAVGDWVLDRLFGTPPRGGKIPSDFGHRLTGANIDAVLAADRVEHARYMAGHPDEIRFIRQTVHRLAPAALAPAGEVIATGTGDSPEIHLSPLPYAAAAHSSLKTSAPNALTWGLSILTPWQKRTK